MCDIFKNKIAHLVTLVFLLISCSRKTYNSNYLNDVTYKSFYIVDTIRIANPVRFHSAKFGGQFIVSKDRLKDYNGSAEFFTRPYVFFMGTDLYRDLSLDEYKKYVYPDGGGCTFVKSLEFPGLEVYEFRENPASFILGIINANYFYAKHNSYEAFKFPSKNRGNVSFRIVYPLCHVPYRAD